MSLASAVPAAEPGGRPALYQIDPVHTRVQFAIDHAGYSRAIGTVSGSTGTITFAPGDWSTAKVDVTVPLARLDLGDAGWNEAALDILDARDHPTAHFVSTRNDPISPWAAKVCGDLTLHGATREACLDVVFNQLARYPLPPFHRVAGFSASGHLQRSDFGIDSWSSLIGDTVEVRIEAEARYVGSATNGGLDE
ncbi:MAG TPA: YceI family protein [Xanthomonadaceae bacterium]|nr:YceI family protein [Xanthomonadaceae bacterium]